MVGTVLSGALNTMAIGCSIASCIFKKSPENRDANNVKSFAVASSIFLNLASYASTIGIILIPEVGEEDSTKGIIGDSLEIVATTGGIINVLASNAKSEHVALGGLGLDGLSTLGLIALGK